MVVLFSFTSFAHSQKIDQNFEIQERGISITPGFCPTGTCAQTSVELTGTLACHTNNT
jgi:hypothetical protein